MALDKGGARKNVNDYIESFIINIETEEQFKEKIARSGIKTLLSYEEILDNMKEALYANNALKSRIKGRHSAIKSNREKVEAEKNRDEAERNRDEVLRNRDETERRRLDAERRVVENNITVLNMALEFNAGKEYFANNKNLENLYLYFKEKGDYGKDNKITIDSYNEALKKMESEKYIEEIECPKIERASSSKKSKKSGEKSKGCSFKKD